MCSLNVYGERLRVKELVFCPAAAFFNHTQYRPVELNGLMKNGVDFEEYLSKKVFFEDEGWEHNKLIVYGDLIEGHPDFVNFKLRKVIETKCRKTLEIKSYDIAQAGIYASILGFKHFLIIVGYLDKDNSLVIREKSFETNPDIFQRFVEHAKRLKKQIESGKIWDEQWNYCPRYDFECRNCVYKSLCEKFKKTEKVI